MGMGDRSNFRRVGGSLVGLAQKGSLHGEKGPHKIKNIAKLPPPIERFLFHGGGGGGGSMGM